MKIDPTKPVKTVAGEEVQLFPDIEGSAAYPIFGAIDKGDYWVLERWNSEGRSHSYSENNGRNLVQDVPRVKRTVYLNLYRENATFAHCSKEAAIKEASPNCIASIQVDIDVEEGARL